ncbi:MAG: PAS domain-containing protein [Alphaproteobacteria bacterium PA2]|nr:MAG: PAS domain-containing protein [Alphaproteobacteria bacterium PA2]
MFHLNTKRLIDYWRSRGGEGQMPDRRAIDPTHFPKLLSQVFVAGRQESGVYPLRLVGGFVAELHAQDLRSRNVLDLFRHKDRLDLKGALEAGRRRPEPVLVKAEVRTAGPSLPLEILFLPLAPGPGSPERFLGLYQPLGMVARLQGLPALEIAVENVINMGPANQESPRLRLAALDGRRIA